MRVRICYTVNVGEVLRRAINHHYGEPGLADREAVKSWYALHGEAYNPDIIHDLECHRKRRREELDSFSRISDEEKDEALKQIIKGG